MRERHPGREFLQSPYAEFQRLVAMPGFHKRGGVWFIVRHRDCSFFMKHPDIGRELEGIELPEPDLATRPLFYTLRHIFAAEARPTTSEKTDAPVKPSC